MGRMVSFVLWLVLCLAAPAEAPAQPADPVSVGALRFSSSGPLFLAQERGYFRAAGLEVTIEFFQDAPTIAAGTAGGNLTFGITALTAATFGLAAEGRLLILAGQAQERRGHAGNQILVTRKAHDSGLDEIGELLDQPFGLTQLGSPSHYQLGQLAAAGGVPADRLNLVPFQTLPNLVAALKSGAVTWAIIAPPVSADLIASGAVVSVGPFSDHGSYQFGAVFAESGLVAGNPDLVRRFLGAYRQGLRDYATILQEPDSAAARSAAGVVGQYVYPDMAADAAADKVLGSALYADPEGNVDVADIQRQIDWYFANGLTTAAPDAASILKLDLMP